jgi:hypothetical protein
VRAFLKTLCVKLMPFDGVARRMDGIRNARSVKGIMLNPENIGYGITTSLNFTVAS